MDHARKVRLTRLLVHELRNPLNVLKLTFYVMSASENPELEPDIRMMQQHVDELDRMLQMLVDYAEVPTGPGGLEAMRFDPVRLVDELLDELRPRFPDVELARLPCPEAPESVELDFSKSRLAISQAIRSACAAAAGVGEGQGKPAVTVQIGRGSLGCRVEVRCEGPPHDYVKSTELDAFEFERLLGVPSERRGLDLAIAARVARAFGGSARLEVEPGVRSSTIFEWPTTLPEPS